MDADEFLRNISDKDTIQEHLTFMALYIALYENFTSTFVDRVMGFLCTPYLEDGKMKYKEISKFPSVKKDLAVVVDKNVTAEEIAVLIKKAGGSSLSKIEAFDVYTGKGIDENKKSIAYSLTFEKMDRTLTDEEISQSMEKIVEMLNKKIGAELRK